MENDIPESAVAKLFASAKSNGAQLGEYNALSHCVQNIPSKGQIQTTASEVQNLLVSGRKKEALQCAQAGQLWGPALVLASQLGEQMAVCQLIPGSPLRTLCLLIAGQPAEVFSADTTSEISVPGAVNTPQQPVQFGSNKMLDDWEENLAVITANRTKDDELVDSSKEMASSDGQGKASGGTSRFSRFGFGSQLLQKTVGLVLRPRPGKQAKLGETNKFYYDEKLKRWVEEGAEPPAADPALPPPPTTAVFQNGVSDYNLRSALKREGGSPTKGGPDLHTSTPPGPTSGTPPIPPSSNQFSARGRMGIRSSNQMEAMNDFTTDGILADMLTLSTKLVECQQTCSSHLLFHLLSLLLLPMQSFSFPLQRYQVTRLWRLLPNMYKKMLQQLKKILQHQPGMTLFMLHLHHHQ
ncbi:hypothetical protein ABKV19_012795 [Rosa sericea]